MDLSTNYLGFNLPHPLVPGASPLTADVDSIKRLEDAGAPLIQMYSLFEEELTSESLATAQALEAPKNQFAEAMDYLPEPESYQIGPDQYLDRIFRAKQAVSVPVMASLNGTTRGGWLKYATQIEQAGADALELNLYDVATDFNVTAREVEHESFEMVREISNSISIPLAVKVSPFYTSLPNVAAHLKEAGADAVVLFNRFYQPNIDVEELELERSLELSDSSELLLRLRWLAVLSGRIELGLAATGGIHTAIDALKATMCGADICQLVSALLKRGPDYLKVMVDELADWLEAHEYQSLSQARGSMSLEKSPNPHAYERANYMHLLRSWDISQAGNV